MILKEDLEDDGKLACLHKGAIAAGWITDSEYDRQSYAALAEYALAKGKAPGALFQGLLKLRSTTGRWPAMDDGADERGRRRVRRWD